MRQTRVLEGFLSLYEIGSESRDSYFPTYIVNIVHPAFSKKEGGICTNRKAVRPPFASNQKLEGGGNANFRTGNCGAKCVRVINGWTDSWTERRGERQKIMRRA